MSFPYTARQIQDIVDAAKVVRRPEVFVTGKPLPFENYGQTGKRVDLTLEMVGGPPLIPIRLHVRAPLFDRSDTFEAALIVANLRVRGIGWEETGRKRFYRIHIPRGWHQNIVDPNLPPGHADQNRHLALPDFHPVDLAGFFVEAARLWHIQLPIDMEVLL